MLRFFNKRLHNRKGFTLIELIVVIAILAILALIAIPRLTGFTDRAKIANDKEYGSIVAHSIQTMIAAGELKHDGTTNIVITITPATGLVSGITGVTAGTQALDMAGADTFNTALSKMIPAKALQYYQTTFSATINALTNETTVSGT